ncbi:hypothetical protein ALQ65_101310 [Pseudomonas syringae pv. coriandricola]|uniref:Uncharacterized protein n=1 Tax=Pseudomonas syringae pv. coriandricola TaxID=264453 RepID=A0A0N8QZS3_9PSED|nr:hypothetical protein ALO76_101406 [Pseudomonas syringae pv. coriandricola]RMN14215.1 hypothetical protein ALQ65_101310 [Pseudomonas syringae pv. coriandricola]
MRLHCVTCCFIGSECRTTINLLSQLSQYVNLYPIYRDKSSEALKNPRPFRTAGLV